MTMPLLFALETLHFFFGVTLFLTAMFLILLILVQRGRGGGLSGALGGSGGQSAFGAKAGDTFTRITVVAAGFWIVLCAASIVVLQDSGKTRFRGRTDSDPAPFVGGAGGSGETDNGGGAGVGDTPDTDGN